jgi:hypothetical protein
VPRYHRHFIVLTIIHTQVAERYGAILQQYLVNCNDHRTELGHQMFVMAKLEAIAMKAGLTAFGGLLIKSTVLPSGLQVKAAGTKDDRLGVLRSELPRIVFPDRFQVNTCKVCSAMYQIQCPQCSCRCLLIWSPKA